MMASRFLASSLKRSLRPAVSVQNTVSRRVQSTQTATANAYNPELRVTTLPNGLQVASEDSGISTCTVGLWIEAGSRYETSANNGTANFLERMIFKGTSNRNQLQLESEIENMGAHLNACTTREQTAYYAKAFSKDIPKAVEILADVIQNSSFSDADIERERGLALKEMEEVEQNHQEVVMDYLHATAYQGTPLSLPVLGSSENVNNMNRDNLLAYIKQHYVPSRMVLAAAGGVDHDKLVELAKQFFNISANQSTNKGATLHPCRYTGSDIKHRNDSMPFVHVAMAIEGVGKGHPDVIPLMIASQIIGSWDVTSVNGVHFPNPLVRRMAREELCRGYQSFNIIYKDTGLWGMYFVSDNDNIHDCTVRMQDEWMRLCTDLTEFEVTRAKNALITNMALSLDGSTPICADIGDQMLTHGRRTSPAEMTQKILSITTTEVKNAVNKYIWDTCPVVASHGPTEAMPDYANIRAKMYKVFY